MKTVWDRIHVWLQANAPEVLANLRPGATEEAIRAAEAEMGVTLPDDVRASYLVHDGQEVLRDAGCGRAFLYGWELCSLARILQSWRCHKDLLDNGTFDDVKSDPSSKVRRDWWHPAWVPVTNSGMGYCHCIDLAPKKAGRRGQIILWCHDEGERPVQAASFAQWLDRFARELAWGRWVTHPDYSGLVHVRDV